jgi:hypothetical protein
LVLEKKWTQSSTIVSSILEIQMKLALSDATKKNFFVQDNFDKSYLHVEFLLVEKGFFDSILSTSFGLLLPKGGDLDLPNIPKNSSQTKVYF